jgi:glycosyltransferase involved in cell wall biosynthesis
LIVPKTDEAAFAAALQRLLDEPDLRRRLGVANRDHVRENYSQGTMFDAYGVLFDDVLSQSGR